MLKYLVVASVYDPENDNSGITLTSEDFFNNYDAYILKIEANKITILGKDTDAVYGDYYGVNLGKVTEITEVNILQGSSDSDHDIFHFCVLEASENGQDWVTLADFTQTAATQKISWTASETTMAQYVRLRLVTEGYNGKPDYWLHVREFTVDYETEDFAVVDTDIENTEGKYEIAAEAGKVTVALTDMPTGEIGNYLLLSLRDAVEISSVTISDTINEAMDITWSFDGKEYVSDFGGLQGLTYMKAVTKENAPATVSGEIVIEYVVYEEPSVSNNGKLDT